MREGKIVCVKQLRGKLGEIYEKQILISKGGGKCFSQIN
jgi:hypothetical protein